MAFVYVWECVYSSLVSNKINSCTWHHCFLVAVNRSIFAIILLLGDLVQLPALCRIFPYIISSTYLIYYWIVLVMVPQLPPLPLPQCLTALSATILSSPKMDGLNGTTCSFRLYSLVWPLSHSLKLSLWRGLQCHQDLCNVFHPQAYELRSHPILLLLIWLFFTLSWSIYCVYSALISSQMHRPEKLIAQWSSS